MKNINFILAVVAFFFLNTLKAQDDLEIKSINGCEKIIMTLGNLIYLVNTPANMFGATVSKFDYAKSTEKNKPGEYTDGKNNVSCFTSVLNRFDNNLNKILIYFTNDETIVNAMKMQLEQMKEHYENTENGFMKYTFSYKNDKYSLYANISFQNNIVKIVKEY